ncbi:hypothetical protein IQ07DRAFT_628846 [Pyrenochaeta sp. DS3sAY3a]|nr:hypothetical protein IQ07DRAFT_628846 [Pyrenochaeta sp. DS3sAY3a]
MRALQLFQHIGLATCAYTTLIPTVTLKTIVFRRDEQPAVSTVGSSTNGYHSGDVILSIPESDNRILDQIISQNICPDSKLKKRFVSGCFLKNGVAMYGFMRSGGMAGFVDMANAGFELPLPPPELDAGVVEQFDQMGNDIPRLNQQARGRLGRIVWWSQYPALLSKVPSNNPVKVIPAAVASRVAPAPTATASARCHYRDRIPYCNNCGGLAGNKERETCIGFGDLWKTCPCLKHTETPAPREILGSDVLRGILDKLRTGNPNITCLGSNATQDIGVWSRLVEKACEHADLSKTILHEGLTVAAINNPGGPDVAAFQRYKYLFRWDPTANQLCSQSCKNMFTSMAQCGDASRSEMAKTGASNYACGTALYKIEDNPPLKVACRGKSLGAPRGNKESNSGTSLDKAIEQFCADNDGRSIKKSENVYQRYGITNYGVLDRSSFWLRGAITCGDEERMKKSDCIEALSSAMEQCDPKSGYSHGLAASVGCLDYSIDLSGVTRDDSPPWD